MCRFAAATSLTSAYSAYQRGVGVIVVAQPHQGVEGIRFDTRWVDQRWDSRCDGELHTVVRMISEPEHIAGGFPCAVVAQGGDQMGQEVRFRLVVQAVAQQRDRLSAERSSTCLILAA